jgi:hypothetical protein
MVIDPNIGIFELVPPESLLDPDRQQSLLCSSDLELSETTKLMPAGDLQIWGDGQLNDTGEHDPVFSRCKGGPCCRAFGRMPARSYR